MKEKLEIDFFKDKQKHILNPDLLSDKAKELAKFIRPSQTSIHQIRKFYNQALLIKQKIVSKGKEEKMEEEFLRQLPYIKMFKAHAAYAANRKNSRITWQFKKFIDELIDKVNDRHDFLVFCDLFEAVVAFCVEIMNTNKNRYK